MSHLSNLNNRRCRKCGCGETKCGCSSPLFTAVTDYSTNCADPQPCDEFTLSQCVIYNGPDIPIFGITNGMPLNNIIGKILIGIIDPACVLTDGSPPPTCEAVNYIHVIKVTSTTITIGWNLSIYATGYTVTYEVTGSGSPVSLTPVSSTTSQQVIINLLPGTSYDIHVDTNCSSSTCSSLVIRLSTL